METIVEIRALIKNYGQGRVVTRALRGLDLEITPGEFTAMAGPSGSGKSTLLNIIGGLDRPTSGSVSIKGRDLGSMSRTGLSNLRRERIGFIFQGYNLIPVMTVLENAEYVLMLQGMPVKERRDKIRALLDTVGLSGLEGRFPRELSGGQQQRVAITRAIAPEPALVLADEPTANVDSKTGDALLDLMRRLNEDKGVTFLFSTHDRAVMEHARRLVGLRDGLIESDETIGGRTHAA